MTKPAPTWANRITGHADVAPDQLLANPDNWRKHPTFQRKALAGVLREVGLVQSVIVNQRTGRLVDGHLRVELAMEQGQATVPVVYVDLSEADERKILATIDPVAALAETDGQALAAILANVTTEDDGLQALLESLGGSIGAGVEESQMPDLPDGPRSDYRQMTFTVCADQGEQISRAIQLAKSAGPFLDSENENGNGNALARICETFLTDHDGK